MRISSPPTELVKAIKYFKGLNIAQNETQIQDNQSPDLQNVVPDDRGALDKRYPVVNLFTAIGLGVTKALTEYKKSTGTINLFAHSDKLYKVDSLTLGTYTLLYTGLSTNSRIRGFTFNDKFYFLDGTTYRVYDGSTVATVTGYIPTVTIGTPATGGGTLFEQLNLISPGFKQQFSAPGGVTTFQLVYTTLDATTITILVNNVAKVEGVDFTVNRTTGVVTFTVAPTAGTNNVEITAYKTFSGNQDEIFKCTICHIGDIANGINIYLTGNPSFIGRDYRSGLKDPTYFPANGFDDVGSNDNPIKGYSRLYGKMIILKKDTIHTRTYLENNGDPEYPTETLTGDIGCESTDSICIIDNFPTFLTKKGVYQVVSIDSQNENSTRHISDNIDRNANLNGITGLLEMGTLSDYVAVDYKEKYWLMNPTTGIVWLYDYRYIDDKSPIGQWFRLKNIYANCVLNIDDVLYYGDSRKGMINKYDTSNLDYSDTEDSTKTAIDAYWTSKVFDYDTSTNLKLVAKVFFTIKPNNRTSASLYVRSNLRSVFELVKTIGQSLFVYTLIRYSTFTYAGNTFPQETRVKVKSKKTGYYQIKIQNNILSESLGLLNVAFKFLINREVK